MSYTVDSPFDTVTIIKTIVVSMIFVIVSIAMFVNDQPWVGISILVLLLLLMGIIYFCIPRKIIVTDTEIVLYNHGFKRTIERKNVVGARKFNSEDKAGLWRKFAAEGMFGYCGIYSSKAYKTLYIYASQSKNWVLIDTKEKKYVISPENLDIIQVINRADTAN